MTAPRLGRWHLGLAVVAALAFAVHAAYSLLASPNILEISDAGGYRLLAEHLERGLGYVRPYDQLGGVTRPTAEFPPGFPFLLAGFRVLGLESVAEQRVALAAVHAVVAVAVVFVARRWFRPVAALAIGAVAALHPALVQPGAALLAESLYVVLVVGVLLAALRLREDPTLSRALLLGGLGGAATLVRSEGVVLVVLLAIPGVLAAAAPRDRLRIAGAVLAAAVVLPGAWAARNLSTFDEPVLLSNNVGSVLSGSNCDTTYSGDLVGYWFISDECFAGFRDEALRTADESEVAVALRNDGLRYIRDNLDEVPRVAGIRVLRTFQLWEPEQQARLATFEGRKLLTERLTGWLAWATYLAAAVGVVACWRSGDRTTLWFLGVPVLVVVVVAAATYGNSRFRIGADVSLLILAAIGVRAVLERRWTTTP